MLIRRIILPGFGLTLGAGAPALIAQTTDQLPPEARLAGFDQDGTLRVEHPVYRRVVLPSL